MTPKQVKKYYGTCANFNEQTGMSGTTLCNWLKWGYVPEAAQYKLERITEGFLTTQWTKKKVDNDE